ncbi:hypothetical protein OOK44_34805 [Streptomyces cellulosae]|uniref:hypothetical protein n=1 Tax=Streptomyces TaxID=1883 RepID=UPI0022567A94|nr:hypothetical protein [Streptomyces sp. OS603R]MCX4481553.1 hypothetical protein [Streptomyces cellulosae]WTC54910.1 hypothetical protein OH715_06245 [Streptomyces cellulosae]
MNVQNSSGDLPVLRRWLDGASSHPLRWYFEYRRPGLHPSVVVAWWNNPILVAVEQTLTILETAAPVGLDGKRRDFRAFTDMSGAGMQFFRTHLAELTVGSHLAQAGVPFRFNTADGPDLLLQCGQETFGVEIGSRHPRSVSDLSHTLSGGLRARGLPAAVSIRTESIPPVSIRTSVRDSIIEAFLPADGSPGVSFLRVEASPARPDDGIPASWLSIQVSRDRGYTTMSAPFDSPHVTAMAQDVAGGVLREKRKKRQAKLMSTVLIVDLSGNDLPDLRRWPETFGALWEQDDEFLAVGGMTVSTRSREPELRFSLNPFIERQTLRRFTALVSGCGVFNDLADQAKGTRRRAG